MIRFWDRAIFSVFGRFVDMDGGMLTCNNDNPALMAGENLLMKIAEFISFVLFSCFLTVAVLFCQPVSAGDDYRYLTVVETPSAALVPTPPLAMAEGQPVLSPGSILQQQVHKLGAGLMANSSEPMADFGLVITSFVNLNKLYATSSFGRLLAEMMLTEMQKAGLDLVDVRMSSALQIRQGQGEYGLSRDMNQLAYVHDAQAVIVGTYNVAGNEVMVNARLLHSGDGKVLAASSSVIPLSEMVVELLADESLPPRAPVDVGVRPYADMIRVQQEEKP